MAEVVAEPHFIFGLRSGVNNNLSFCDERTLLFPAGNSCVCYSPTRRSQRLLPGRPEGGVCDGGVCELPLRLQQFTVCAGQKKKWSFLLIGFEV